MPTSEGVASVAEFNELSESAAVALLHSCLAVPRWAAAVVAGRPYADVADLLLLGRDLAATLTTAEVEAALARHPRIGEPAGAGHDAEFSEREQSEFDHDDADVATAMDRGNAEYERRFARVFLIRAAGRSAEQILGELRRRLSNSPEREFDEVVRELGEIAVLRLEHLVDDARDPQARQS